MNKRRILILLISLFAFFNSYSVYADSCYNKSPNLRQLGNDGYYSLKHPIRLSSVQQEFLNNLFSSMQGQWTGSSTITTCLGSEKNSRVVTNQFNINTTIARSTGLKIRLDTKKYNSETKITSSIKTFIDTTSLFDIATTNDSVTLTQRYRTASGSILSEWIINIKHSQDSLYISSELFNNGIFASSEQMILSR